MDRERIFNDLGIDAITGVDLMNVLGLNADDFLETTRFMRFKDIIGYFKDIPDKNYIIRKITTGKIVDKLDHVWSYTELARQKSALKAESEAMGKQFDAVASFGDNPVAMQELISKSNRLAEEKSKIEEQMQAYEF